MKLTTTQLEAVACADRSTAIVAGAGSGKTAVIVERAARLLRSGAISPENLCCITFTEKAAAELKSRIAGAVADLKGINQPHGGGEGGRAPSSDGAPGRMTGQAPVIDLSRAQISTFHSAQGRILREQAAMAGIDPDFTTLDEMGASLLLSSVVRETVISRLSAGDEAAAGLVDAYRFNYVTWRIAELVELRWNKLRWGSPELPAAEGEEAAYLATIRRLTEKAETGYESAKRLAHRIDFVDLELLTCELLENNPDLRKAYQKLFKAIIVDEAQDINANQENFCRLLHSEGLNTLTIVGDPKQSIYRFRGADVSAFGRLMEYIEKAGGRRIALRENHRSSPAICSFVNEVSCGMTWFEELVPTKIGDGEERIIPLRITTGNGDEKTNLSERRDEEAKGIAQWLRYHGDSGAIWRDFALLFFSKADMHRYADALKQMDIPRRVHSGGGFLDRPEILDLTAALRVVANHSMCKPANAVVAGNAALLRLLRSPLIGLADDECYKLAFPDLTRTDLAPRPLSEAAMQHAKGGPLIRSWIDAATHIDVDDLIEFIVQSSGYGDYLAALTDGVQAIANIEKLYWLARSGSELPLEEWITYLDELARREARIPDQPIGHVLGNCVHIMTIHAAKGLEFSTVVLPDLLRRARGDYEAWIFGPSLGLGLKLPDQADLLAQKTPTATWTAIYEAEDMAREEERRRLLYVALTRARDRIVLPIHEGVTNDKGTWHDILSQIIHGQRD